MEKNGWFFKIHTVSKSKYFETFMETLKDIFQDSQSITKQSVTIIQIENLLKFLRCQSELIWFYTFYASKRPFLIWMTLIMHSERVREITTNLRLWMENRMEKRTQCVISSYCFITNLIFRNRRDLNCFSFGTRMKYIWEQILLINE